MKKWTPYSFITIVLLWSIAWLSIPMAQAASSVSNAQLERYISNEYHKIDFKQNVLSYEVFKNAYKGYLNLMQSGKLNEEKRLLTILDFSLSSTKKRMWVIDMQKHKVVINDYVAHGQGSGMEFATSFSDIENSHQSSLGFYVTGEIYTGEHGTSLRLYGVDKGFNTAAFQRAIVIHGADYVCESIIQQQNRLGRSWGCPAVSIELAPKLIQTIHEGTCLFIYASDKKYLANAYWLNKKPTHIPKLNPNDEFLLAKKHPQNFRFVYDESAADIAPEGAQIVAASYWKKEAKEAYCPPFPLIWKAFP